MTQEDLNSRASIPLPFVQIQIAAFQSSSIEAYLDIDPDSSSVGLQIAKVFNGL